MNKTEVILNKPLVLSEELKFNQEELLGLSLEKFLDLNINNNQALQKLKNESSILINGIEMNIKTPIVFLYLNFSYMDSFLYITIN